MKLNIRILTFLFALVTIIASAFVLFRPPVVRFAERVKANGATSVDASKDGFVVRVGVEGVVFMVPKCEMNGLKDRFFMHVYTAERNEANSESFINRDFDMSSEPNRRVLLPEGEFCVIERAYGALNPKEVVLGQFSMPEGHCCEVIWSRDYILEK